MDVLAPIGRAIHAKHPVSIRYHSMNSGESERVIAPFALVDTGLRWHVRAFDRKSGEFRDFVVTRIEAPALPDEQPKSNERPDNDIQWTRIVEDRGVGLGAAPASSAPRSSDGLRDDRRLDSDACPVLRLLRWSVDASPDHSLKEEQFRLWLSDSLDLYGVENAKLAPGCRPPAAQTKK